MAVALFNPALPAAAPSIAERLAEEAVIFSQVTVARGDLTILNNLSFVVPAGSCFAVIGPNGAGKTTLLKTLLGEMPYRGQITLTKKTGGTPRSIAYVPQQMRLDRDLPLTVLEFFAIFLSRRPLWTGISAWVREQATAALKPVKAEHLLQRQVGALSGGERQRVLLALALSRNPDLLILDEPDAGVDVSGGQLLCDLLDAQRRRRGFTQIFVSHDLALVRAHATHVAALNRQLLAVGTTSDILTDELLAQTFGFHRCLVRPTPVSPPEKALCLDDCCATAK